MSVVEFERIGRVAVITLNRPEVRNAVDGEMAAQLSAAVDRLEADPNLRVGVLAAAVREPHPVFCAGQDLRTIRSAPGTTPDGGFAGLIHHPRTKPLVAAVDGLASSGGCEIVLACDLVVASTRSSFAVAEIRWNLVALAGGAIRLPRVVGKATALDMVLTGRPLSAERAYQLGLVSTLVEGDVREAAVERAAAVAEFEPDVIRANLQLAGRAWELHEAELWEANDAVADEIMGSASLAAGVAAFERRRADPSDAPRGGRP